MYTWRSHRKKIVHHRSGPWCILHLLVRQQITSENSQIMDHGIILISLQHLINFRPLGGPQIALESKSACFIDFWPPKPSTAPLIRELNGYRAGAEAGDPRPAVFLRGPAYSPALWRPYIRATLQMESLFVRKCNIQSQIVTSDLPVLPSLRPAR